MCLLFSHAEISCLNLPWNSYKADERSHALYQFTFIYQLQDFVGIIYPELHYSLLLNINLFTWPLKKVLNLKSTKTQLLKVKLYQMQNFRSNCTYLSIYLFSLVDDIQCESRQITCVEYVHYNVSIITTCVLSTNRTILNGWKYIESATCHQTVNAICDQCNSSGLEKRVCGMTNC